jgi:uncharacterized repeat protein (TIGR03803 family)
MKTHLRLTAFFLCPLLCRCLVGCSSIDTAPPATQPAPNGVAPRSVPHAPRIEKDGFTESILYSFAGTSSTTAYPAGTPYVGSDGAVFGTSVGENGTVFRLTSDGTFTILHRFPAGPPSTLPVGGVIRDSSGALYGTAAFGVAGAGGSVFKLTGSGNNWSFTTIHAFAKLANGLQPFSSVVEDSSGALYGTTSYGGNEPGSGVTCPNYASSGDAVGCGIVFKLAPSGSTYNYSVLYRFSGKADGFFPSGSLVIDSSGNIYGTTAYGGVYGTSTSCGNYGSNPYYGCGTVFELSPSGSGYTKTTLYEFPGTATDGANPFGGLTGTSGSALYGSTSAGGSFGCGTIFEISGATESVLHDFDCHQSYISGTILNAGQLYTSDNASSNCCGAIFQTDASTGANTKLYTFTGAPDGSHPTTPYGLLPDGYGLDPATGHLFIDSSGDVYGVTAIGGTSTNCSNGCGTIFELINGSAKAKLTRSR